MKRENGGTTMEYNSKSNLRVGTLLSLTSPRWDLSKCSRHPTTVHNRVASSRLICFNRVFSRLFWPLVALSLCPHVTLSSYSTCNFILSHRPSLGGQFGFASFLDAYLVLGFDLMFERRRLRFWIVLKNTWVSLFISSCRPLSHSLDLGFGLVLGLIADHILGMVSSLDNPFPVSIPDSQL